MRNSSTVFCIINRYSGAMWRCFRDKLSHDCPELINDFYELLEKVMNDYEQHKTSFE